MTAVVYIHGRGGDAAECGHYRALFPDCEVIGLEKLNGVELSDGYLRYVRNHPVQWDVPTHILYGSEDPLVPLEAVCDFAKAHNATLTVMDGGGHWFHTDAQMRFLDNWICAKRIRQLAGF